MRTIFFTVCSRSSLPSTVILDESLKKAHPTTPFFALLVDGHLEAPPRHLHARLRRPIGLRDLQPRIPHLSSWVFRQELEELRVAAVALGLRHFLARRGVDRVVFLGPTTQVLRPLNPWLKQLDRASLLLAPRITDRAFPESLGRAAAGQEGLYHSSFLALRGCAESKAFLEWWIGKLMPFERVNPSSPRIGAQLWLNLVPALFPGAKLLDDPHSLLSQWNVKPPRTQVRVVDHAHFEPPSLAKYRQELAKLRGRDAVFEKEPLEHFSNGQRVLPMQRELYRRRPDLMKAFPKPLRVLDDEVCFFHWYREDLRRALKEQISARRPSGGWDEAFQSMHSYLNLA